jgi:hypothetical protein
MRLTWVALLLACAKPPPPAPPPKVVGPPKRDVGPLIPVGWTTDRIGCVDAPIAPDGDTDFMFRVRVSGDARAFVLFGSDATGASHGGEVWDTIKGPEKYPASWHMPYPDARHTWAIAVFDSKGTALNPNVTMPTTTFDGEELTLVVGDLGHARFVNGRTYTLFVVRSDGTVNRATTTIL